MNGDDFASMLSQQIAQQRKATGITQQELADRLGISFQAVSKWETGLSCPDISLLPRLAGIFGVSVDSFFGLKTACAESRQDCLPWEDDGVLRAVAFIGTKYMAHSPAEASKLTFEYKGEALSVTSAFSVVCNDVNGDLNATGNVVCNDVDGDVASTANIVCNDVDGDVSTMGKLTCDKIEGDATAGDIKAGEIGGDVTARGDVKAQVIHGDVRAASVRYEKIEGDILNSALQGGTIPI
jgi:transcriptional regulator with XRE-family HTH domain